VNISASTVHRVPIPLPSVTEQAHIVNTPQLAHFEECLRLLPERADSEWSWTAMRKDIEAKNYDLKAVNPNARAPEDLRTPEELLDLIEAKGWEVAEAVAALRALRRQPAGP
jgi:hypothetical protein